MKYLGDFTTSNTVYVYFNTFDSNDPSASVTLTGLAVTDIEIYKDGSVTQRSSDAGYTLLDTDGIDFDGTTGIHGFSIDLSDNTDAGFYAAGSEYAVVVSSVTVDAATINFVAATFSIERSGGALALLKGTNSLANIEDKIDIIDTNVDKIPLSDGTNSWNATALAAINAEADTALTDYDPPTRAELTSDIATVTTDLDDIKGTSFIKDTHSLIDIQTELAVVDANVDKVPLSDGTNTWNATALASINAEADTALTDYDPPTNAEMEARTLVAASYFDPAADTVATVTTVTNQHTLAEIADGVWDEARSGHTTAGTYGEPFALQLNGTCASSLTTTTFVSDLAISVNDQYVGRTIMFGEDTATAALQGQTTDITGCTASTNLFTFTALTTQPGATDTFVII